MPAYGRGLDALISDLLLSEISSSSSCLWPKAWRVRKKTHASSPSTSGKTHEKTCPIPTRRETRESSRRVGDTSMSLGWQWGLRGATKNAVVSGHNPHTTQRPLSTPFGSHPWLRPPYNLAVACGQSLTTLGCGCPHHRVVQTTQRGDGRDPTPITRLPITSLSHTIMKPSDSDVMSECSCASLFGFIWCGSLRRVIGEGTG